jgi:hypothetical protein
VRVRLSIVFPALGSVLLFFALNGCVRLADIHPTGPWHEAYQPIEHEESREFLAHALAKGEADFGVPAVPVNDVLLRRSRKTKEARRYAIGEDFSLTSCIDTTNGTFVVYLRYYPDERNYYAILGHECAHLMNARIMDWYMEGIATVFSEELCDELGKPWGNWKRHLMKSRREPYALSYRMMREMKAALPEAYPLLMQYLEPNQEREGWLRIDINGWLDSLPDEDYAQALEVIRPYADRLQKRTSEQYDFAMPEALR